MQTKYNTKVEINKIRIEFTEKKITAYGGFSMLALFFEKIKLRENLERIIPILETSPNGKGLYSKVLAYVLMIYAGGLLVTGRGIVFRSLCNLQKSLSPDT